MVILVKLKKSENSSPKEEPLLSPSLFRLAHPSAEFDIFVPQN